MKTWKELLTEINAIETAMRMEKGIVEIKDGQLGVCYLLVRDRVLLGCSKSGDRMQVHCDNGPLPALLDGIVRKGLEDELIRLRAQASEELKTLALIAAGATP